MKPKSISEQMMYNTIRLETESGCGTGSYFNYKIGDYIIPVIITNKHVVNYNEHEKVTFFVHTKDNNGDPSGNIKIQYDTNWIFHRDKDICFCYVNPIFEEIKNRYNKEVFYIANDTDLIPTQEKLEELSALEELVMVGYPIGLWDQVNNFPIFRKGFTACHPGIDFNEKESDWLIWHVFLAHQVLPFTYLMRVDIVIKKETHIWGHQGFFSLVICLQGHSIRLMVR